MKSHMSLGLSLCLALASPLKAAESVPDILKHMLGCFRVSFTYIEDGEHDAFFPPVYERAELAADNPISFTRYLIVDGIEQLHWSDKWTQIKDQRWQQEVTGPYGDLRYRCDGDFTLNQWTCLAEKSAKPRRDQGRPYAFLDRHNTLQINNRRWVHSQINRKITETGAVYSVETGWNTYERVEDNLCQVTP